MKKMEANLFHNNNKKIRGKGEEEVGDDVVKFHLIHHLLHLS
jgi:hypothetical protein